MFIKYINSLAARSMWLGRMAALSLLLVSVAACEERQENPDVVVVSPSPSPVSPSPNVVVVSPSPVSPSPNVVVVSPTPAATATGEPITDVVVITSAPNQQTLVNRQVQFANVPVQSVIGDRTFWVGTGANERLLVVLDEALDSGGTEKALDINAGQTLTMSGLVRRMITKADAQKEWGLSAAEADSLQNQQIYLQASQVQIK